MLDTDQNYASKAAYELAVSITNLMLIIALQFFAVLVAMTLWNWFVPAALGLTPLTYWQTFGLDLLALAFRGFKQLDETRKLSVEAALKHTLWRWPAWGLLLVIGYLVHLAV